MPNAGSAVSVRRSVTPYSTSSGKAYSVCSPSDSISNPEPIVSVSSLYSPGRRVLRILAEAGATAASSTRNAAVAANALDMTTSGMTETHQHRHVLVARLGAHDADAPRVPLLLGAGFEQRPLLGAHAILVRPERHGHGLTDGDDLPHVLGHSRRILLAIGLARRGHRGQHDAGPIDADTGL